MRDSQQVLSKTMSFKTSLQRCVLLVATALVAVGSLATGPSDALARRKKDKKAAEEEIDHVSLAGRLIQDGYYDRAELTLRQADITEEGFDLIRYHMMYGMIHIKKSDFASAKTSFNESIKAGLTETYVYLFLAQAHHGLKEWDGVVAALEKAGPKHTNREDVYTMWANAHWEQDAYQQAMDVIAEGTERFAPAHKLTRIKVFYLIELGLFLEAADAGVAYLNRPDAKPDDYVAVGEALKRANQTARAREILEQGHLRFSDNPGVLIQLAHNYMKDGKPSAAAELFEIASRLENTYRLDAAELYSRANRLSLASTMNAGVADQEKKIKQRLSILIKQGRFVLVAGMEPRLSRLGLLEDESIRYALAYAHFKLQNFSATERHLKELRSASYFDKAANLRKAIVTCKDAGWECI